MMELVKSASDECATYDSEATEDCAQYHQASTFKNVTRKSKRHKKFTRRTELLRKLRYIQKEKEVAMQTAVDAVKLQNDVLEMLEAEKQTAMKLMEANATMDAERQHALRIASIAVKEIYLQNFEKCNLMNQAAACISQLNKEKNDLQVERDAAVLQNEKLHREKDELVRRLGCSVCNKHDVYSLWARGMLVL